MNSQRSQGDGMEAGNIFSTRNSAKPIRNRISDKLIYRPPQRCSIIPHAAVPKEKIVPLIPKLVQKENKHALKTFVKSKEPKFVPYEPYKGAVAPILPKTKTKKKHLVSKFSKNNVDIQVLVSQMSTMASAELKNTPGLETPTISTKEVPTVRQVPEVQRLELELRALKDSNAQLEKQLKFQTQVNGELKTLLVAAVGEDLEARVQLLTEDKLQLARALLNSAQHLSTHREQVEWLAGHCEVWRSKFLASSLMVDELARWKTVLTGYVAELQECIKGLLEDYTHIGVTALRTQQTLSTVLSHLDNEIKIPEHNTKHAVALINACENLAQILAEQIIGSKSLKLNFDERHLNISQVEALAHQALTRTNEMAGRPESVYGALLQRPNSTLHCAHCDSKLRQK